MNGLFFGGPLDGEVVPVGHVDRYVALGYGDQRIFYSSHKFAFGEFAAILVFSLEGRPEPSADLVIGRILEKAGLEAL